MKTRIIKSIIATLCAACPLAHADEQTSSASSSVITNSDGTATVTIEVNGKKETKTFKLGKGEPIELELKDGTAVAVGGVHGGGGKVSAQTEKETWLGVNLEPVRDEVRAQLPLKDGEGLTVTHVMPESPAAKAGIEKLDIVTRLDDQILVGADQLSALVKMRKPGDKVRISYLRKGEARGVEVTLEEHERAVGGREVFKFLGNPNGIIHFNDQKWDAQKGELGRKLKELKKDFPGMIVDKQAWLLGPDGAHRKLDIGIKGEDLRDLTQKYLNQSELPDGVRDQIQRAVNQALKSAEKALNNAQKTEADPSRDAPAKADESSDAQKQP